MKKTLIALVALAGIASADTTVFTNDEFNTWYQSAITGTGYTAGDDYTFTFTMANWPIPGDIGYRSGMLLNMTDTWGLFTQAGQYLAFDDSNTNDRSNLKTSDATYGSGNTSTATGSLAQGTEGWFYTWGNGTGLQENTVFTLTCEDGVDTVLITKDSKTIANFTITGDSALNAALYAMKDCHTSEGVSYGFNISAATFTANGITRDIALVPEPTTATLSLLALAGLAARRRRR